MNAIFCSGIGTEIALHDPAMKTEDCYATAPLSIVIPKPQVLDEDILHASFDAALSDRVTALHNHWNSWSGQHVQLVTTAPLLDMHPGVSTEPLAACTMQSSYAWPQRIIYSCLVLILLMIGFDLMGLLVLNTH